MVGETDTSVLFSCEITFAAPGNRLLTAHYLGNALYEPSQSGAVPIEVTSRAVFQDGFESP